MGGERTCAHAKCRRPDPVGDTIPPSCDGGPLKDTSVLLPSLRCLRHALKLAEELGLELGLNVL